MFAAVIKLGRRPDRAAQPARHPRARRLFRAYGSAGGLGFIVVLLGILVSLVPPGDSSYKFGFELKLLIGTTASVLLGLVLYWRGARAKASES